MAVAPRLPGRATRCGGRLGGRARAPTPSPAALMMAGGSASAFRTPAQHPRTPTPAQALQALPSRREALASTAITAAAAAAAAAAALLPPPASAAIPGGIKCPGLNGYALSKCLKELRLQAAAEQAAQEEEGSAGTEVGSTGDVQDARAKYKQYEQPGTLVTLPSGLQYREIDVGSGREAELGAVCEISYVVYRLSSGAYFKYSSGGTPVLLFALGFGFEGQRDEDEVYRFRLGDPLSLPAAVTPSLVGMREGGRRRILVPPRLGWVSEQVGPQPPTFGGQRRLVSHRDEPLLFEAVLARVQPLTPQQRQQQQQQQPARGAAVQLTAPFRLPAPPSPSGAQLRTGAEQ